ncbi:MAG TPA: DoxX family protein [Gemmatimonadales bacterium]|nr:DoxX family protein [Gemmatimonadales bacterium]
MTLGLLILRLVVGLTMAAHGSQKLFGWFGGYGLQGTGGFLEQLGFIPGRRNALFAGSAEFAGGLLLALGLATPLAATLIISVMFVAIATVHVKHGYFNQNQGYEYPLLLGVVALTITIIGAGPISLDAALNIHDSGPVWGIAALVAGLGGGAVQLATRRAPVAQKAS